MASGLCLIIHDISKHCCFLYITDGRASFKRRVSVPKYLFVLFCRNKERSPQTFKLFFSTLFQKHWNCDVNCPLSRWCYHLVMFVIEYTVDVFLNVLALYTLVSYKFRPLHKDIYYNIFGSIILCLDPPTKS